MSDSIPHLALYLVLVAAFIAYFIFRKKSTQSGLSEEMADVKNAAAEGFGASEQVFPPSKDFVSKARVKGMDGYRKLYQQSINHPEEFWTNEAKELTWFEPWTKVLDESKKPFFKWFVNGKTNISYNCIDAQIKKGLGDKVAIVFEGEPTQGGEPTEVRRITYKELLIEVSRFANVLKRIRTQERRHRCRLYADGS
jgi:acetyl-CoA synthetase